MSEQRNSTRTARVGFAGLVAMLVTHLLWDTTLTLVGIAQFGLAAEGTPLVRDLIAVHPFAWIGAKLVVVGGGAAGMYWAGIHRDWATAWGPWLLAVVGFLAPLGWLRRLLGG